MGAFQVSLNLVQILDFAREVYNALNPFEFFAFLNKQLIPCLFFLVWFLDEVKLVGYEVEYLVVVQVDFVAQLAQQEIVIAEVV